MGCPPLLPEAALGYSITLDGFFHWSGKPDGLPLEAVLFVLMSFSWIVEQ